MLIHVHIYVQKQFNYSWVGVLFSSEHFMYQDTNDFYVFCVANIFPAVFFSVSSFLRTIS